jgi:hypothetical protein
MSIAKLRLWTGVLAASCATLGAALPASAQDNQAENIAAARSLGIEGVRLAEAGKCTEAIEKLSRAEALYHAPTILGRLGECQVSVGQIVIGTENLNRVVREPLAPNAPKPFKDAQVRAQKVLDAALPRIGHLTVLVEPKDAKLTVTVSGVAVPPALLGVERPTDPGTHEVVASAPGYLTQKSTVQLAEAGRETVTLQLLVDPNAPKEVPVVAVAATTAPPAPPPQSPPPESNQGVRTLSYVLIGVGVTGVAAGSITGAMAISKKGNLDCPQNHCSGQEADDLDSAKTLAVVSTISFAVGIPAAIAGTVLLLTSKSAPSTKAETSKPRRHFAASPYVGPTSAGVVGSFW